MNLKKRRNENKAKLEAMKRAKREGGEWERYFDEELEKAEQENPSANDQTWENAKAELKDIFKNVGEKPSAKPTSETTPDDLDVMTRQQLEILSRETQLEIEDSEARLQPLLERPSVGLNTLITGAGRDYILRKKKLLAAIEVKLKSPVTQPQIQTQQSKEQKKAGELEAVIKEQEQVLATASPQMRPYIERLYREKIDKIMDS